MKITVPLVGATEEPPERCGRVIVDEARSVVLWWHHDWR